MKRRVIAKPAKTQKPTSQSQRKRKKTTRAALSLEGRDGAPHRRQAVLRLDDDVGPLGPELVGERRAGASCPSPTLAVRIRMRGAIGAVP